VLLLDASRPLLIALPVVDHLLDSGNGLVRERLVLED
jgi:hypothetical protein